MYQDYFGLNCKPFGIVPDTRFLFLSDSHKEAIAHLVYALNEKNGFVQLTGEVGVGKTMACRYILGNLPKDIDAALILNPIIDEIGLLRTLCQELEIPFNNEQHSNELTLLINKKLLDTYAKGRHSILIIDEAQNLPKPTLEQLRLLTNLETDTQKLLRIILIGQPELGELLSEHDMRQVAQRITSRYHLGTLNAEETDAYIRHRLKVAGCERRVFSKPATRKVFKLTEGTPRLINLLCDRALLGAYSLGVNEVSPDIIKTASKEALPFVKVESQSMWPRWIPAFALLMMVAALAVTYQTTWRNWLTTVWPPAFLSQSMETTVSQASSPQIDTSDLREPPTDEGSNVESGLSAPTAELIEKLIKQADTDFRLGIPSDKEN